MRAVPADIAHERVMMAHSPLIRPCGATFPQGGRHSASNLPLVIRHNFRQHAKVQHGTDNDDEDDGYGNVYITRIPDEKLKFLAETKKTFALSISTGVLYKQVNTLPCVIVRQITEAKADILIQKTSYPECYKFGK